MPSSSWRTIRTSFPRWETSGIGSRPSEEASGRGGLLGQCPPVANPVPAMIALESVSKRYGAKTVIHDLSFTVERGEVVGFLGPNGAGKTTNMRMIAGYTAATSGRVTVAGYDMASESVAAARQI